jgi:hypothetical protein
VAIYI